MSTQSISTLSKDKYLREAQEILIYNFEQYFYYRNFRLGTGIDEEESLHNMYLSELLCDNNCEVYNYLYDKIAGKLKTKKSKKLSISESIGHYNSHQHPITMNTKVYWTDKTW